MTKPKKEKMEGADACVCMHTALRKLCDSAPTSALYNIVHMHDVVPAAWNAWLMLGQLVADEVGDGTTPETALRKSHKRLDKTWEEFMTAERKAGRTPPEHARSLLHAITCTMRSFDDGDWSGMAGFLGEE